jgi:hypothetical protein
LLNIYKAIAGRVRLSRAVALIRRADINFTLPGTQQQVEEWTMSPLVLFVNVFFAVAEWLNTHLMRRNTIHFNFKCSNAEFRCVMEAGPISAEAKSDYQTTPLHYTICISGRQR